jgi:protein transport protein SEC31
MKLKEIHWTSTSAWSLEASFPFLATGTIAGAFNESFSNESHLELWAPNLLNKDELDRGSDLHKAQKPLSLILPGKCLPVVTSSYTGKDK